MTEGFHFEDCFKPNVGGELEGNEAVEVQETPSEATENLVQLVECGMTGVLNGTDIT